MTGWYTSAPGSFMYSLRNYDGLGPFKVMQLDENDERAIYRHGNYGPTFGWGHDLGFIADNTGSITLSVTNFGSSYNLPPGYTFEQNNTRSLLAGSYHFTPSEVEVLYLN